MTKHEELAAEYFLSGAGCAQAVFCAFCDLHGIERRTAALLTSSLCGGVGRLREVCGAFSGAVMVLGVLYGFDFPHEQSEKSEHYKRVQQLAAAYRAEMSSVVCREILESVGKRADTDPMPEQRNEKYYRERPCVRAVRTAARILDEYIERENGAKQNN